MDIFNETIQCIQLAKAAIDTVIEYKNAPKEMSKLSEKLEASGGILKQARGYYETYSSMPLSSRPTELEHSYDLVLKYVKIHGQVARDVQRYIDKTREEWTMKNSVAKVFDRTKWVFRGQERVRSDTEQVQTFAQVISQYIEILSAQDVQDTKATIKQLSSAVEALSSMIKIYEGKSSFQNCIDRLLVGPFDFGPKIEDYQNKARESPPSWVFQDEAFRKWTSSASSDWLWGIGDAGTGKTCIASFLVNQLQEIPPSYDKISATDIGKTRDRSTDDEYAVEDSKPAVNVPGAALFCCSFLATDLQTPNTVFYILIRQLLLQLRQLDPYAAWRRVPLVEEMLSLVPHGQRKTDSLSVLKALSSDFATCYIMIDALDEYGEKYGALLGRLKDLVSSSSIKLFLTSRGGSMKAEAESQNALILDIGANKGVIHSYVAARLEHIAKREDLESQWIGASAFPDAVKDPKNRELITNKIVDAAANNFLCAELQINGLKRETNPDDLQYQLDHLSSSLKDVFKNAINRVKQHSDKTIGMKALQWAVYARRALTVTELQYAVAFSTNRARNTPPSHAQIKSIGLRRIVEATGYFLSVDEQNARIQVHKAVQEFCDNYDFEDDDFQNPHTELAKICLRYMDSKNIRESCLSKEEWQIRVEKYPLLDYATHNWGWHMGKEGEALLEEQSQGGNSVSVVRLLKETRFLNYMAFALDDIKPGEDMWNSLDWELLKQNSGPIVPALHILTYFNLRDTAQRWLEDDKNDVQCLSKNNKPKLAGYSAIWLACRENRPDMVRLFLFDIEKPADVLCEGGRRRFCLAPAAFWGYSEVARILLEETPENIRQELIKPANSHGRKPLAEAAASGNLEIVNNILEVMSRMDEKVAKELILHQDDSGNSALHEAARGNHGDVVKLLVQARNGRQLLAQHDMASHDSPLHVACRGRAEAVRAILDLGADTAVRQKNRKTPLHLAVGDPYANTGRVVEMLIQKTDLMLRDNAGRTPLHAAAKAGRPRHIPILMAQAPKELFNAKDNQGLTAIIAAARSRHGLWKKSIVQLLRAAPDEISLADAKEVFRIAIRNAFTEAEMIECLLACHIKPIEYLDNENDSILHQASKTGSIKFVRAIWQSIDPSDLERRDKESMTPLLVASYRSYLDVANWLIEKGADINAQDSNGRTALHHAVESGNDKLADHLLEKNIRWDLEDATGVKALERVSAQNACCKLSRARLHQPRLDTKDVHEKQCIFSRREGLFVVSGDTATRDYHRSQHPSEPSSNFTVHDGEYLLSEPIPSDAKFPLFRVEVLVRAHDQGWSDDVHRYPSHRNTYINANTWFDLALVRHGKRVLHYEWSRIRHGTEQFQEYQCSWRLQTGHDDSGVSKWQREQDKEEARRLVRELRVGDQIALVARTQWSGWAAFVDMASIAVFYEE